jgi:hypothetical protein
MKRVRLFAALLAAALVAPISALAEDAPPPAAPAPAESLDDPGTLNELLAEARRAVLEAEHELRQASAAVARASRGGRTPGARLVAREQAAEEAFAAARRRVPEVVAQARAAGVSDAVLRSYEHSLYGD